ncbi:hypothetical protein [Azoarcus taiwanensis]|uniref:Uncharacterized protein n=1 Tax=Azoarcus taiwanensis TaxID=666964 RepID=A0A972F5L2_9RHOO|nr:hypothetical protein [Azoarcus taiwanensis]NMG01497.1 hypothetical protein [Azoarcus taiwanensis]
MTSTKSSLKLLGIIATIFGLLTLISGGQALFLGPERGVDMGQVVTPVLAFNFLAGFAYVAAGIGIWKGQRWAARLAVALAAMTIIMFTYLGVHILSGGAFELRTVIAMGFRTAFWAMVAFVAMRGIRT